VTYGVLKSQLSDWLNRSDLDTKLDAFITNAENTIYRTLSHRLLEKTVTFDRTSESPLTDVLALPSDYREAILLTVDGTPIERVSLDSISNRTAKVDEPTEFSRNGTDIQLWPFPDAGRTYKLTYYHKPATVTGGSDSGTNDLLTAEPALFLYGSLIEAEPYLHSDQMPMLSVWASRFGEILATLDQESSLENYSGSNVTVKSTFSGRL